MSVFRTVTLLSVLVVVCRALLAFGAGAKEEEARVSLDGTWRLPGQREALRQDD